VRTFIARALDLDDEPVERQVTAVDSFEAHALLESEGLTCIRLREIEAPPASSTSGTARQAPASPLPTVSARPTMPTVPQTHAAPPGDDEKPTVRRKARDLAPPLPTGPTPPSEQASKVTRPMPVPTAEQKATAIESLRRPQGGSKVTRPMPVPSAEQKAAAVKALATIVEPEAVEAPPPPRSEPRAPLAIEPRRPPRKPVDPRKKAMSPVDRMSFFSSIAGMLAVGIPLMRAVRSLQFADPVSDATMEWLATQMSRGNPLSAAMATLPSTFTTLQIGSVKGAERGGNLPAVMARLHQHEERTLSLTRQVRATMTYPLVVFVCAVVLVSVIGRTLVTSMLPVLEQARIQATGFTALAVGVARALDNKWLVRTTLVLLAGGLFQLWRWLRTPPGREFRDRALMRSPILGGPLRKVEIGRLCESIATLYESGLPLLQCLDAARDAAANLVVRQSLASVMSDMKHGSSLSESMGRTGFFDRTVAQLVYVGEESGNLKMAFSKIAQYNDLEVRTALDQFAAAIEPVMLLVLGFAVGTIALIAFAPLYQLASSML